MTIEDNAARYWLYRVPRPERGRDGVWQDGVLLGGGVKIICTVSDRRVPQDARVEIPGRASHALREAQRMHGRWQDLRPKPVLLAAVAEYDAANGVDELEASGGVTLAQAVGLLESKRQGQDAVDAAARRPDAVQALFTPARRRKVLRAAAYDASLAFYADIRSAEELRALVRGVGA